MSYQAQHTNTQIKRRVKNRYIPHWTRKKTDLLIIQTQADKQLWLDLVHHRDKYLHFSSNSSSQAPVLSFSSDMSGLEAVAAGCSAGDGMWRARFQCDGKLKISPDNATGAFHNQYPLKVSRLGSCTVVFCHLVTGCPVEFQQIIVLTTSLDPDSLRVLSEKNVKNTCGVKCDQDLFSEPAAAYRALLIPLICSHGFLPVWIMVFYKREIIQDLPIECWEYIIALINYGYYEPTGAQGHQPG